MYAGAAHADTNEYGACIALWNHALKLKMAKETLLSCDTAFTARAIVQLYVNIVVRQNNGANDNEQPQIKFEDVLATAKYLKSGVAVALDLLTIKPKFKVITKESRNP